MPEVKPAVKKERKKSLDAIKRYVSETRAEFNKIVWPARKTVVNNTIVVLVSILVVGIIIWCLDTLSSTVLSVILQKYS